jgi:hypothetical protein
LPHGNYLPPSSQLACASLGAIAMPGTLAEQLEVDCRCERGRPAAEFALDELTDIDVRLLVKATGKASVA